MTNEVSTEVKSLNDVVRDKVKESFVGLIPDDQWNKLVEACVESFKVEDLPKIIKDELRKKLAPQIATELDKLTQQQWDPYGKTKPSQLVELILKSMTADIINELIGGIAQNAIQRVSQQMRY